MRRHGYTEECYFDLSLDPIRGERGSVGGIFNAVLETTYRVLGERRMRLLRRLAERTAGARSAGEVCALAAEAMGTASADVPFALLYLADPDGRRARLASAVGIPADGPARDADLRPRRHRRPAPLAAKLAGTDACPWPLSTVAATGKPEVVSGLAERFGRLPGGPWPEPAREALVLPIAATGLGGTAGLLVAGLSPRRTLDDEYRGFLELAAGHLATAVAAARAHELERRRVESLAELDRDRTAFFSNISHEFRTPLTLMLGALENLLAAREERSPAELRDQLVMAHRNGLRLMKLVNTLLDFSRIEAGRAHASYEPTDLAALSADLAGSFRSGCEQAGLRLVVDCPALPSQVHVDRDMWEKIVLNLLSNAFKYTLEGEIEVRLQVAGAGCELTVRDTGVGIPEPELLRVFERFHRVEAQRGRTHEGTGIGLALVKELVDLHGGSVRVESAVGRGSVFAVRVPFGTAHLPADRIGTARELASTVLGSRPYVEESLRWIPAGGSSESAAEPSLEPDGMPRAPLPGAEQGRSSARPLVLWADDNADMREYVRRLLAPRFEVEAVPDGETALEAARRRRPDLVLADVMMPRLDGFALLRELRSDPRLRTVPVVLLSARAGEESQVEGLGAGADDYLVKPFSARELLARVGANLELARARQEVERAAGREEALREANRRKDEFLAVLSHELRNPLAPIRNSLYIL
ncbi:MAG TPA: ATP-binding protein, partial [Methylomirabilota bacterium]|nr:ATP-binding protein [Methylomirabilota bacterium]